MATAPSYESRGQPKIDDQRFIAETEEIQVAFGSSLISIGEFTIGPYRSDTAKPRVAPDVFGIKYLPMAGLLPPEVRKLFFGYYGIR